MAVSLVAWSITLLSFLLAEPVIHAEKKFLHRGGAKGAVAPPSLY